jgi:alpha-glucosidase (family GH31 glycosyl hydrolase)
MSEEVCWYYYANKLRGRPDIPESGFLKDILLENNEYGVYVKGGTILPLKIHNFTQAILRTLFNPIKLDIFLNVDRTFAEGTLYIDDGESFNYQTKKEQSYVRYKYSKGNITCEHLLYSTDKTTQESVPHRYPRATDIYIVEINIYGLDQTP